MHRMKNLRRTDHSDGLPLKFPVPPLEVRGRHRGVGYLKNITDWLVKKTSPPPTLWRPP